MGNYFVYILTSKTRTLYVGMTNDIHRRIHEHKNKHFEGFTSRYDVNELVYFETHATPKEAIDREKQIKKWRREKKIELIECMNPDWDDLSQMWER